MRVEHSTLKQTIDKMNSKQISLLISKIFNTIGNSWLVENFETEPFDFRVFLRKGDDSDLTDYVVEVYTDRPFPKTLKYRDELNKWADGADISSISYEFKQLLNYIDRWGDFRKTVSVNFMDMDWKEPKPLREYRILKEDSPMWVKRRLPLLKSFIDYYIEDISCDDFMGALDFSNSVISKAVDDFLLYEESFDIGEDYDSIHSQISNYSKDKFEAYLVENFNNICKWKG